MTGVLAVALVLCVAGCGTRTKPARPVPPESPDLVKITVEVKGMTKALNIT
jgi:hypothetical protein